MLNTIARWVRTIGQVAAVPTGALMIAAGLAAYYGWIAGPALWLAAGALFILIMTIPARLFLTNVPGETAVERFLREREQSRARAELARYGLTPQQYLASFPASDVVGRALAADRLGLELDAGG